MTRDKRTIPLFWWNKRANFGDLINPFIVESLTGNEVVRAGLGSNKPFYMAVGSVLNLATNKSIIWGSGIISEDRLYKQKPKAVHAVRGPLTRAKLIQNGCPCPPVYGDPALLLPRIYHPKRHTKYNIGILPHYIDREHRWVKDAVERGYHVIDIINPDPIEVLDQILECRHIATSSLHGLVVADAYNIPSAWIGLSDKLMGGHFKFNDYFLSVHKQRRFVDLRKKRRARLNILMDNMADKKISIDLNRLVKACPMF